MNLTACRWYQMGLFISHLLAAHDHINPLSLVSPIIGKFTKNQNYFLHLWESFRAQISIKPILYTWTYIRLISWRSRIFAKGNWRQNQISEETTFLQNYMIFFIPCTKVKTFFTLWTFTLQGFTLRFSKFIRITSADWGRLIKESNIPSGRSLP